MKSVLRLCTHFSVVLKFLFAVCCVYYFQLGVMGL
jgi:hypothetical protein